MNLDWQYPATASQWISDPYWRTDFAALEDVRLRFAQARPDEAPAQSVELFNVWWMPQKSFIVVYKLHLCNGKECIETVRFLANGESKTAYSEARAAALDTSAITHLQDWSAISWRFPEDAGLPTLPALIDLQRTCRALDLSPEKAPASWSLLSYLPAERAAMRISAGGGVFAGKIQAGTARTHAAMEALWRAPSRHFVMAEPIAFDDSTGARWERFLPGKRFELEGTSSGYETPILRMIGTLAQLHALQVPGLPVNDAGKVMDRIVRKVSKRIAIALPDLAPQAERTISRLSKKVARLPRGRAVTMHGDFHTANVIFDGEEPGLIDLDNLALGDPEYDLALFATRVLLSAVAGGRDPAASLELTAQLPLYYREASGRRIDDGVFTWYLAALLVGRQVKTCIRHAVPNLEQVSQQLLSLADAALEARFSSDCLIRGDA